MPTLTPLPPQMAPDTLPVYILYWIANDSQLFQLGGSCLLNKLTGTTLAMLSPKAVAHQHMNTLP